MVLEDGDVCEICRCEKDNIQYIFGNVNLFKFMVKLTRKYVEQM